MGENAFIHDAPVSPVKVTSIPIDTSVLVAFEVEKDANRSNSDKTVRKT